MKKVFLKDIAYARSGDKGDVCNIGLMAKSKNIYNFAKKYRLKNKPENQLHLKYECLS